MNIFRNLLCTLFFLQLATFLPAQTPGALNKSASPAINPLDPNGDGFVTTAGTAFTANEEAEFELPWIAVPQLQAEPSGDTDAGGSCGPTDLGSNAAAGADATYYYYTDVDGVTDNGDDLIMFRLRATRPWNSGSFGFSVVLDTDAKVGFSGPNADPNAVTGNPGFELEIRVKTGGGSGIFIDNIDGTTNGTNLAVLPLGSNYQQPYAYYNTPSCTQQPVFHDFFVRLTDIGITSATPLRIVSATSQSGGSVLGGAAADFGGVDDNLYPDEDSIFVQFAENQIPTSPNPPNLPVAFTGFSGVQTQAGVVLSWTTEFEFDNDYFSVESSADGKNFQAVASISSQGNSGFAQSYSLTDPAMMTGARWYRIRQVDLNGSFSFSQTIEIQPAAMDPGQVIIYPNPANGLVNVSSDLLREGGANCTLISLSGQTFRFQPGNSSGNIIMDVSDLEAGIYVVKTESGTQVAFHRVIVE